MTVTRQMREEADAIIASDRKAVERLIPGQTIHVLWGRQSIPVTRDNSVLVTVSLPAGNVLRSCFMQRGD